MKKIIGFIIAVIFSSAFVSCAVWFLSDEDFAPYDEKTYRVSVKLNGNSCIINTIEQELLNEAEKYLDEPNFGYFEYMYKSADDFTASFYFSDKKDLGEMAKTLHIDVNICDNSIYLCKYTYGLDRRVSETSVSYISDYIKETNIGELISDTINNNNDYQECVGNKDHFIKAVPGCDEIIISAGSKEKLFQRYTIPIPNNSVYMRR